MTARPCCTRAAAASATHGMVRLPGGRFLMGSERFYPEERPQHEATVGPFWIDATPVTNAQFQRFVDATGHVTQAQRALDGTPAGSLLFRAPLAAAAHDWRRWWTFEPGTDWRCPGGPGTTIDDRMDHPVVHVSWHDAQAYAAWAGKQLPTEAQWEFAARGGLSGRDYAWGDEPRPAGRWMANTWQGAFPVQDLALDGWAGTSPVGRFPPNGYGLLDMAGNVWEWTRDAWRNDHRAVALRLGPDPGCCTPAEPGSAAARVLKGGSHLCADDYCLRYRPAARIALTPETSTDHAGLRCVIEDSEPRTPLHAPCGAASR